MSLKHTLALLVQLEAEGKLVPAAQDVQTLYDPNHLIHLTVQATGADVREQFLAAVMRGDEPAAEPKVTSEPWTEAQQAEWDALSPKEQKAIRDKNLADQGLAEPAAKPKGKKKK